MNISYFTCLNLNFVFIYNKYEYFKPRMNKIGRKLSKRRQYVFEKYHEEIIYFEHEYLMLSISVSGDIEWF